MTGRMPEAWRRQADLVDQRRDALAGMRALVAVMLVLPGAGLVVAVLTLVHPPHAVVWALIGVGVITAAILLIVDRDRRGGDRR